MNKMFENFNQFLIKYNNRANNFHFLFYKNLGINKINFCDKKTIATLFANQTKGFTIKLKQIAIKDAKYYIPYFVTN